MTSNQIKRIFKLTLGRQASSTPRAPIGSSSNRHGPHGCSYARTSGPTAFSTTTPIAANSKVLSHTMPAMVQPRRTSESGLSEKEEGDATYAVNRPSLFCTKVPPKLTRTNDPDYRKWKDKESEILRDVEPIILLTKDILHSQRYMDGDQLTPEDEKAVVAKLLAYHPQSEDKVDRHPQFKHSRCLFVVRTDGGWIDFSYQKCIRSYIRDKYPSYAERFIAQHFKRGS